MTDETPWFDLVERLGRQLDDAREEAARYRLAPFAGTFRFEALQRALAERDEARADADALAARLRTIPLMLVEADRDLLAYHDALVAKR